MDLKLSADEKRKGRRVEHCIHHYRLITLSASSTKPGWWRFRWFCMLIVLPKNITFIRHFLHIAWSISICSSHQCCKSWSSSRLQTRNWLVHFLMLIYLHCCLMFSRWELPLLCQVRDLLVQIQIENTLLVSQCNSFLQPIPFINKYI